LIALPVINGNDALAGIVTFDDVLDVAEEEATEDFYHMGAAGSVRTNIKDASIWLLYRNRAPWLLVLVFMNIFSGAGIAFFQDTIESMVALVFFLPLLIDSGGNAGSQSATLVVRALATGEVELRDWFRLILKEFAVGLTLALSMAVAVSMVSMYRAPEVAVVIAVSMVLTVLAGSLIGMLLPFLLTRVKLDPATASAPLITSIADIAGVLIYFSIATWYLGLGATG
jgi:magnesium transporter